MRDPVRHWARTRAASAAMRDAHRSWTYAELDALVEAAAVRLSGAGVSGRPAALLTAPTAHAVIGVHAILRAGGTVAPLHPRWTGVELRDAVERLRPAVVLAESRLAGAARAAAGTTTTAVQLGDGPPADGLRPLVEFPEAPLPPPRDPDQPCATLWTSGSSGVPRGVALSWRGFETSADAVGERLALGPDDSWLASLALAHVGGLALLLRAAVLGSRVVLAGEFDAGVAAQLVEAGDVTHVSLVPTMFGDLLRVRGNRPPPPSLAAVLLGGAATPPALLATALECGYPVALTYGLTETTSQVATAPPDLVRAKPGTVGAPLRGVAVRVGVDGEIEVRGRTLFVGYADESAPLHLGGWYRTGDTGRLDEDGHLWVTGRLDDRILSGGVTVFPAEVERVIGSHPDVEQVAVIGTPDARWGEAVVAVVVPGPGRRLDPDALDRFGRERLGPAKRPRRYQIREALPRTANGKIDRAALARNLHRPPPEMAPPSGEASPGD